MIRPLLALCAAALVATLAASTASAVPSGGLAFVSPVPLPSGTWSVRYERCPTLPEHEGCVDLSTGTIYLATTPKRRYLIFLHELGHLYDWRNLDEAERRTFRRLIREPRLPWWMQKDPDAPFVGDFFADAYAVCALGWRPLGYWPGYLSVRSRLHKRVCAFIRSAA